MMILNMNSYSKKNHILDETYEWYWDDIEMYSKDFWTTFYCVYSCWFFLSTGTRHYLFGLLPSEHFKREVLCMNLNESIDAKVRKNNDYIVIFIRFTTNEVEYMKMHRHLLSLILHHQQDNLFGYLYGFMLRS